MQNKSFLSVPIAIVIAGAMIAGAVFYSNRGPVNNPTPASPDISIRPVSDTDFIRGNPNAKVVIVEYSDPECPFCKDFHKTMKSLVDKLGKDGTIAWVYRHFPIESRHPKAPKEAEALQCAGANENGKDSNTNFWAYTDKLYEITPSNNGLDEMQLPIIARDVGLNVEKFKTCLASGQMSSFVSADRDEALKSGGNGTPYSIFISQKEFNPKLVEDFATKYRMPPGLMAISTDNKKVSVNGAMPQAFLEELIAILTS